MGRVEGSREKCAIGAKIRIHTADICTFVAGGILDDRLLGGRDSGCSREETVCLEWRCPTFLPAVFRLSHLVKAVVRNTFRGIDAAFVAIATILQHSKERGEENAAWVRICGRQYFFVTSS